MYCCVIQLPSHVWLFSTLWIGACQASLSLTISQNLPKFIFIELVMPSKNLIFCHPLFLLPSIFPSTKFFFNELALCIRWPKCWPRCFHQVQHQSFQWYSGLISFKIDSFDIGGYEGCLRVFSSATVQKHQFFGVQLSLWSNSHIHTWLQEKP